jgi:hypothetical protein
MKLRIALLAVLFCTASAAQPKARSMVFSGDGAEQVFALRDLDSQLVSDWTPYPFLVVELRLSSPQRFDFRVHTADGVRSVRLSPVCGTWVRSAIPLTFFTQASRQGMDLASVHNKPRAMMWINLSGTPGPLQAVREIGFSLPSPVGSPVLEIRSLRLAKDDPGDLLLDSKPLIDEFGQWIGEDWPGKAKSVDQLKRAWDAEEKAFTPGGFDYCKYGGFQNTKARATGFFRVEKIDGRWWFVDPDGHLFFSAGSDSIGPFSATPVLGREQIFAKLPAAELSPSRQGGRSGASFYTWNLERRFGREWIDRWVDLTLRRMTAWGFNTVGNWSDVRLGNAHRMPYVVTTRGWGIETGPMGVADVYAADYAERVDRAAAQQCDSRKDDPFLLGYFLGNEPPWPGQEAAAVDAILAGPASATQAALKTFLATADTPERRQQFLLDAYRKLVEIVTAAVRRHDPNHLSLGLRFGSSTPPDIVKASAAFDVYSLNCYAYTVNQREVDRVRESIDRPIVIGEFHFGTPGRGMPPGLKQTSSQEERGVAYRFYVEHAAADPSIVGTHWFEWIDEPASGRFHGENYNIGLVDVTDQPYRELIEAAKATHRRLIRVHLGTEPPVARQAKIQ